MKELVKKVYEKTGIPVTEPGIARVIAALLSEGEFWAAMPYANAPFNVVAETVRQLHERGYVYFVGSKVILTEEGDQWLAKNNIHPLIISTCKACEGKGIELNRFLDLLSAFKLTVVNRPPSIVDFDQGYVTEETTVARVVMMAQNGDIHGKDLLVLGDDDLLSLAAGLSGLPNRVVVFEIDERIVDFINEAARKNGLPVTAYRQDLREPLPDEFLGAFDTFLTDPPETPEALELFISRGIAGLKGPGCAGYFGVTYAESSKAKWREFQERLASNLKVVITDMVTNFNIYENWNYLLDTIRNDIEPLRTEPQVRWYRSTQYRIETLEETVVSNEPATGVEIYVDNEALVYTRKGEE